MIHVKGDLLENDCQIIVHQINCLCVKPRGLAESIVKKYPYADIYRRRRSVGNRNLAVPEDRDEPGGAVASFPVASPILPDNKIVIGIYGQYDLGKSFYKSGRDFGITETRETREKWFQNGLSVLANWLITEGINIETTKIGFPYKIGCGLAGGNWNNYEKMLEDFTKNVKCKVYIYHLN